MKVGIISDLHGYPEQFKKAEKILQGADMVLCAGDIMYHGPRNPILEGYNPAGLADIIAGTKLPLLMVKGNCDSEVDLMVLDLPLFSPAAVYDAGGTRFLVLHGHKNTDEELSAMGKKMGANVVVTGHTHVKRCIELNGVTLLNPGSISVPKDGSASLAVWEDGVISFINIENGEKIEVL